MHRARSCWGRISADPEPVGRHKTSTSFRTRRPPYATAISVGMTCLGDASEVSGCRSLRACTSKQRTAWFWFTCLTIVRCGGVPRTNALDWRIERSQGRRAYIWDNLMRSGRRPTTTSPTCNRSATRTREACVGLGHGVREAV